jgi:hypothetical protein
MSGVDGFGENAHQSTPDPRQGVESHHAHIMHGIQHPPLSSHPRNAPSVIALIKSDLQRQTSRQSNAADKC